MSLDTRPILSALLRNRTGAVLVALQIAIALAVLVNGVYIVHQRVEKMNRPTLVDDRNLFGIGVAEFNDRFNYDAGTREDITYLRSLPGVISASITNSIPLGESSSGTDIWTQLDTKGNHAQVNVFYMDEQGINTLGVRLLAGRPFRADEIQPPASSSNPGNFAPQLIVTKQTAEHLFPRENALGRTVYDGVGNPATLIGIVDNMIGTG